MITIVQIIKITYFQYTYINGDAIHNNHLEHLLLT